MAQEDQKASHKLNELGIAFSNLDRFGLTYKTGRNQSLWRFHRFVASGNLQKLKASDIQTEAQHRNTDYTLKIGRTKISEITENFEFRFGADWFYSYSQNKDEFNIVDDNSAEELNENVINSFGMNLVFGFHHSINNRILVGAEVLPYFSYRSGYSKSYTDFESDNPEKKDISGYSYGFSNNSVQINITYRF
jgi:hypothetical protein